MGRFSFKYLLLFALCAITPCVYGNDTETQEAEALAVRRIVALWKENESQMVRAQIQSFLKEYPKTAFADKLYLMLGDIEAHEGNAKEALSAYEKVRSEELRQQCSGKLMQVMFKLKRWDKALELARPFTKQESELQVPALLISAKALYEKAQGLEGDRRKLLCREAKDYCDELLTLSDEPQGAALLAQIYQELGEAEKGIQVYEDLARKYPEKREAFLFQSAALQLKHNQGAALHTLRKVQQINGPLRGQAAFHEVALLVKMGRYSELVQRSTELAQQVPDEKIPVLQFYLGRAYFELKNYSKAAKELSAFFGKSDAYPDQRQVALLMLLQSAQNQGNSTQAQRWYEVLEREAADQSQLPTGLLLLAQTYTKRSQYPEALGTVEKLLTSYPKDKACEAALQLKVSLLYKQGRNRESREAAVAFIERYPSSKQLKSLYQSLAVISLSLLQQDDSKETQKLVVDDLKRCMASPGTFTSKEESQYQLKLARVLNDMGRKRESQRVLEDFIEEKKTSPLLYQAHYMLAVANYQNENDYSGFAFHAEHVLRLNPKLPQRLCLKRNLFTAYMYLANKSKESGADTQTVEHYEDMAAQHLFDLTAEDPGSIEEGQLLWLANFYYDKVAANRDPYLLEPLNDEEHEDFAEQAVTIFRKVLKLGSSQRYLPEGEELLTHERNVLRLTTLLGWQASIKQQITLLEQLHKAQNEADTLKWRYAPQTEFSLAYAYEQMGQWDNAREKFQALHNKRVLRDPQLRSATQLHLARTRYQTLAKSHKIANDTEVKEILKLLEELEIRRQIAHEPIHLEAAIDRAEIFASLCDPDDRERQLLEGLSKVKAAFTARDDLWSKDYHASREQSPKQDHIYQAYIMLIDARISYLQLRVNGDQEQRRREAARTIFHTLLTTKFSVSRYLIHQAKSNLKAMDDSDAVAIPEFCDEPRAYF